MNEYEWFGMYKPKGRADQIEGLDTMRIEVMKCMNCDLVRLLKYAWVETKFVFMLLSWIAYMSLKDLCDYESKVWMYNIAC